MRSFFVFLAGFFLSLTLGCGRGQEARPVTSQVLADWIRSRKGLVLVDVRTVGEYHAGHIPTAINIPLQAISADPSVVQKGGVLVLYCRSGNRSGQALEILQRAGHRGIINFGGLFRWEGKQVTGSAPGQLE